MLIIGHRGAPTLKRENTISSFQAALKNNVDGLELDVQLTKDKKLIVYHDFYIINYQNEKKLIANLDLQQVRAIYTDYHIPTLDEVLNICSKDIILNIEIKSTNLLNVYIINETVNLLIKYQLNQNTIISSFNPFVLIQLKKVNTNIKIGLLWTQDSKAPWFVTHYSYVKLKPYSFHASINYIDQNTAHWVKNKNMKLFLYTINTKQQLDKAKQLEAHAIFSDNPNILNIF